MDEMVASVKSALQACCNQLKVKIIRQLAAREQLQRRKNLTKYVPNAAAAIFKVMVLRAPSSRAPPSFCAGLDSVKDSKPRHLTPLLAYSPWLCPRHTRCVRRACRVEWGERGGWGG